MKKRLSLILVMLLVLTLGCGTGFAFAEAPEGIGEIPDYVEDGTVIPGQDIVNPETGEIIDPGNGEVIEPGEGEVIDPEPVIPEPPVFEEPKSIDDRWVRIGLKYGSTAPTSCNISADSGLWTASYGEYGLALQEDLMNTSVSATVSSGFVRLQGNQVSMSVEREEIYLMPGTPDGIIKIDGTPYRGGVLLRISSGRINVINCLTIHDYLYGVIHKELSQSHPLEALKAQAVAARSFTAGQMNKHASMGFDLCTSGDCQAYGGYNSEYTKTRQAVDETEGLVIYSQGKLASANYHSVSGGHTLSSQDVWGGTVAHLVGVEDPYSPSYPWTVTMTLGQIQEKLEASGRSVGTLQSVSITKRGSGNAVTEMQFTGTSGTVTVTKNTIRTVLGSSAIKSQMFSIGEGVQTAAQSFYLSNGKTTTASEGFYAVSANGTVSYVPVISLYVESSTGKSLLTASAPAEIVSTDSITFTGQGHGHCVGMSQLGASAMAEQGFTYDQILKFYYTGVEIDYAY